MNQHKATPVKSAGTPSFLKKNLLKKHLAKDFNLISLELADVIDLKALQAMMDNLYAITRVGFALIDLKGNILAGAGWQDICTKFHRVNPKTLKNCLESDLVLTRGVKRGDFRSYKCKNHIWDVVTPLFIGEQHVGNIFTGQFFYEDETVDEKLFARQAEKYGFDKDAYLDALRRTTRLSRQKVMDLMKFYVRLTETISKLGIGNLNQAQLIADQKNTEEALRENEERMKRAQDIAHLGSWELDLANNRLSWSDEVYHIFGLKPQEFKATYEVFLERVHPEDRKAVNDAYASSLSEGRDTYEIEHRVVRKSTGEIRYVHEKCEHIRDKSGKIIRSVGMVHDITQQKRAQEKINHLASFPQNNPNPIIEIDACGKVIFSNLAVIRALERLEVVKKIELFLPSDIAQILKDLKSGKNNQYTREVKIKDSYFIETIAVIPDLKVARIYARDITQRKLAEIALEKLNEQLETRVKERTMELIEEIQERQKNEKLVHARNVLLILSDKLASKKKYLGEVAKHLQEWSGCSNIGIRVLNEEGVIPYEASIGFSKSFLEKESNISLKTDQCACIRAVKGEFEPQDKKAVNPFGSFWTNNSADFLKSLSEEEKLYFRGNCIKEGFLSIGVIPIKSKEKIIAAMHLADKRAGRLTPGVIEFIQGISPVIAEAIEKFNMQERARQAHIGQSLVNSLLRLSFESPSPEKILNRALEMILSVSWFCFESKGAIFLVEERTGSLLLKAHKGLSDTVLNSCSNLSSGKCLCGQAALTKKIQFASHVDSRHEITYSGMRDHGHYCVPIMYGQKLLGVLNVYLREGFVQDKRKEEFLFYLANTLAGIVQRIYAERELLAAQKDLQEAKRLSDIGTLAATVAHELRNPLGVIRIASFNLKKKTQDPGLERHFSNIEKKIHESEQIINNLLFYSRIKKPHYEKASIYDLIEECAKNSEARFNKRSVKIINSYKPVKKVALECDPIQIKEVLANIINNAFDALHEREGVIEIAANLDEKMEYLSISVRDSGVGISAEDLNKINEPFFTTKAKGTGLGLTVCHQIVGLHAGKIDIQSKEGQGTTVTVALPVKAPSFVIPAA